MAREISYEASTTLILSVFTEPHFTAHKQYSQHLNVFQKHDVHQKRHNYKLWVSWSIADQPLKTFQLTVV
jgi:hypothetical protein